MTFREILLTHFLCISCMYTCTLTHDQMALYTCILYVYGIWEKIMALYMHHHLINWYTLMICPQWPRWYDGMPSEAWWCYERIYLCMVWHLYVYAWHCKYYWFTELFIFIFWVFYSMFLMSIIYWFLSLTYSVHYLYWRPFCMGTLCFMTAGPIR